LKLFLEKTVAVKNKNVIRRDGKRTDKKVFYCESCERCWEVEFYISGQKYAAKKSKMIRHISNFPSYGKPRKICRQCKEENHVYIPNR